MFREDVTYESTLKQVKSGSIMIVEDENIIALDIRNRLRNLGFNICAVVSSGEEAVRVAEKVKPDLVLMDIVLRGKMDGLQAAENILEHDIPVIFLTSYSDENTLKKVKEVSSYGYLIKPFNEVELKRKIDRALY